MGCSAGYRIRARRGSRTGLAGQLLLAGVSAGTDRCILPGRLKPVAVLDLAVIAAAVFLDLRLGLLLGETVFNQCIARFDPAHTPVALGREGRDQRTTAHDDARAFGPGKSDRLAAGVCLKPAGDVHDFRQVRFQADRVVIAEQRSGGLEVQAGREVDVLAGGDSARLAEGAHGLGRGGGQYEAHGQLLLRRALDGDRGALAATARSSAALIDVRPAEVLARSSLDID